MTFRETSLGLYVGGRGVVEGVLGLVAGVRAPCLQGGTLLDYLAAFCATSRLSSFLQGFDCLSCSRSQPSHAVTWKLVRHHHLHHHHQYRIRHRSVISICCIFLIVAICIFVIISILVLGISFIVIALSCSSPSSYHHRCLVNVIVIIDSRYLRVPLYLHLLLNASPLRLRNAHRYQNGRHRHQSQHNPTKIRRQSQEYARNMLHLIAFRPYGATLQLFWPLSVTLWPLLAALRTLLAACASLG